MNYYHPSLDRILDIDMFLLFLNNIIDKINRVKVSVENVYKKDVIVIDSSNYSVKIHPDSSIKKKSSLLTFVPIAILPKSGTIGHFNVLIIDNKDNTFTYYEPYGYILDNGIDIERLQLALDQITTLMRKSYPNHTYIDAHRNDKNKNIGVQYREESFYTISHGYCVAWCLYLCYIRLYNSHILSKYSISSVLNSVFEHYTDGNLVTLIRVFISFVKSEFPEYQSRGIQFDEHQTVFYY
jgi:hypothetical protein